MIRNEDFKDGVCVRAEVIDMENFTFSIEEYGQITMVRALTNEEILKYGPQPLNTLGALATLLAVQEVVTVNDAANAVGLSPQDLINEANAWKIAGQ